MPTRLIPVILVIGLCCIAGAGQATNQPDREENIDSVHPGTISGGVYRNPYLGVSLEIPQGWTTSSSSVIREMRDRNQKLLIEQPQLRRNSTNDEIDSPLLVMIEREPRHSNDHRRIIRIQCTDVSGQPGNPSGDGFLKSLAETGVRLDPDMHYADVLEPITLGGKEFWKLRFTQKTSILWHGEHLAAVDKSHILQIILTSPDEGGLSGLESILRTIHFDAH